MTKTKWGVLSTAKIGTEKVIPGINRSKTAYVAAIASRDLGRAEAAAQEIGIEKAYGSYEELLADPKEQAVKYLVDNFPKGSFVAAGSPGVVWASKMSYGGLTSNDVPIDRSSDEFLNWMEDQGVTAIYVDHDLYRVVPVIWNLIEPQIGTRLERVFEVDRGNYQILIFKPGS